MNHLQSSRRNCFVSDSIDRMAVRRTDEPWHVRQLKSVDTRFLVLWRDKNLVQNTNPLQPVRLRGHDLKANVSQLVDYLFLGALNGTPFYVVDMPPEDEQIPVKFSTLGDFKDLRQISPLLHPENAALLAYARGLAYWRRHNRYCGTCGHPTTLAEAGHLLVCGNPACDHKQFPRTDPAIIVVVGNDQSCLLGSQSGWPRGMYSAIAGFVEPGESLETAVAREVAEETGVKVGAITYHSSQPWPFPCSIMLGFSAQADKAPIRLTDNELEDARWFSREEIMDGLKNGTLRLPSNISISYRLIESWFDAGTHGTLAALVPER